MQIVPTWSYTAEETARPKTGKKNTTHTANPAKPALAQVRAFSELSGVFAKNVLEFLAPGKSKAQTMFHAPRTRMNERVEYDTRAIATCSLPLDTARAIGAATGGKVNDVVLSVIDAPCTITWQHTVRIPTLRWWHCALCRVAFCRRLTMCWYPMCPGNARALPLGVDGLENTQ